MKKIVIGATLAFALTACDKGADSQTQAPAQLEGAQTSAAASQDGSNVIRFADGTGVTINGDIVKKYTAVREGKERQHYLIDFKGGVSDVDEALSAVLEKNQYLRQVKGDSESNRHVYYRKAGKPIVVAVFAPLPKDSDKTRLALSWEL